MISVLYVDNHILVVDKPAGLATQPSLDNTDSMELQAKEWVKKEYAKTGAVFLHAVHRIDKPVGGIVLFARTSKALSRLNEAMRAKAFSKQYMAVVEGIVAAEGATLEHYLVHGHHRALIAEESEPEAKFARLHFRVLSRGKRCTLIEVDLDTGRYHQIRAQLSAIGHPIVGDEKYGAIIPMWQGKKIGLHQWQMSFSHPVTQNKMTFTSRPGWDLTQLMD
jgi:23S rRNA pseudouridine1911/1915/1917 synthase